MFFLNPKYSVNTYNSSMIMISFNNFGNRRFSAGPECVLPGGKLGAVWGVRRILLCRREGAHYQDRPGVPAEVVAPALELASPALRIVFPEPIRVLFCCLQVSSSNTTSKRPLSRAARSAPSKQRRICLLPKKTVCQLESIEHETPSHPPRSPSLNEHVVGDPWSPSPIHRTQPNRRCHRREATQTMDWFLCALKADTAPPTDCRPLSAPGRVPLVFIVPPEASARESGPAAGRL